MLIVMKKNVTQDQVQAVKQYLSDLDFDFHQSTGANRVIIGVIGDTHLLDMKKIEQLQGVQQVFKISDEE